MNHHKNDTLYEQYRQDFGDFDEAIYWAWVRLHRGKLVECLPYEVVRATGYNPLERHHIWSVNQRPDYQSNLLMVQKFGFHSWFHTHPQEARVICVTAKLRKAAKLGPQEFDVDELHKASGKHVAGIIESYEFKGELLQRLQRECLERLKEIEVRA